MANNYNLSIKKKIYIENTIGRISKSKSRDAIIIHGMFSGSGNMYPLKEALNRRNCYNKIHLISMQFLHKIIPQLMSRQHAEDLSKKLLKKINKNKIIRPIDIIGHSNGGYVALYLTKLLNDVNYVYTIATPPGIIVKYGLNKSDFKRIVHIKGSKDVFNKNLKWEDPPTESELLVEFPDEGHCSILSDSENNGLADFISFLNGNDKSGIFIDKDNTLHIWPWCKDEVPISFQRSIGNYNFKVCNGIHKYTDKKIDEAQSEYENSQSVIKSIVNYFYMRKMMKEKINNLKIENNLIRSHINSFKKESEDIDKEIKYLEKKLITFEKLILDRSNVILKEYKKRIRRFLEPMEMCIELSSQKRLSDEELTLINNLLIIADSELQNLYMYHNNKLKNPLFSKHLK